jgi:COMPASS component SWD3
MSVFTVPNLVCQHTFQEHIGIVHAVAISPDQTLISAAGEGGNRSQEKWTLWIWDLATGEAKNVAKAIQWQPHQYQINSLAFSTSGQFLCAGSSDQTSQYHDYPSLSCWEVKRTPSHSSYKPEGSGISIVASHSGRSIFATMHGTGQVRLWKHPGGGLLQKTHEWKAHSGSSFAMLFSPDGRWLCSGGTDGVIKLWDAQTGEYHLSLSAFRHNIRSLAFSPDGSILVSGSDQRIKIWDLETGEVLKSFFGHPDWIRGLVVTRDGQFLLSTGDAKIKIWDIKTGKKLQTIVAHDSPIRAMALSQDGTLLTTGSTDGTVKVWQLQ